MIKNKKQKLFLKADAIYQLDLFEEVMTVLQKETETFPEKRKGISFSNLEFLYRTLAEDVCRKCPKYRECFGEDQTWTLSEISRILDQAGREAVVTSRQASVAFRKKCVYLEAFIEELSWLYKMVYQNQYWENRLLSLRQVMHQQMNTQLLLVRELKNRFLKGCVLSGGKKRKIRLRLLKKGIHLCGGEEYFDENGDLEVRLVVRPYLGSKSEAVIAACLSAFYEKNMRGSREGYWLKKGCSICTFSEEGNFHIIFGQVHRNKRGETVCGDTFSFANFHRNRAIMLLSDGMGVGESAREGSKKLIETLETMIEAGISEEYALEILHNALLFREKRDFSTVDVSVVSLKTGMLKTIKAGGTATFIRHGNRVERIQPESLPPGCAINQQFDIHNKKLYDGDMIVMVSDGMLEFEQMEELPFSMEEVLVRITTTNAQAFASQLMEAVPELVNGHDDDRTVLVASVWEKHPAAV